eukprot:Nitzschia sp. Nitz4//scaffold3_size479765//237290//237613//NITZ4_000100-RA/size479765-processed-gene-1.511-mRNA-1//-1//CDS//3329550758//906//frame0
MHPPLDRPHPDCQAQIDELRNCQDTRPFFKVWACNKAKHFLDVCFKQEKERMLKEMNKDIDSRRAEEEALAAISTGQNMTFEQFLAKDKAFQKEITDIKNGKTPWFQ